MEKTRKKFVSRLCTAAALITLAGSLSAAHSLVAAAAPLAVSGMLADTHSTLSNTGDGGLATLALAGIGIGFIIAAVVSLKCSSKKCKNDENNEKTNSD